MESRTHVVSRRGSCVSAAMARGQMSGGGYAGSGGNLGGPSQRLTACENMRSCGIRFPRGRCLERWAGLAGLG